MLVAQYASAFNIRAKAVKLCCTARAASACLPLLPFQHALDRMFFVFKAGGDDSNSDSSAQSSETDESDTDDAGEESTESDEDRAHDMVALMEKKDEVWLHLVV